MTCWPNLTLLRLKLSTWNSPGEGDHVGLAAGRHGRYRAVEIADLHRQVDTPAGCRP